MYHWVRLAMYILLSLIIGGLYFDIANDQTAVQDRISVLFVVAFLSS